MDVLYLKTNPADPTPSPLLAQRQYNALYSDTMGSSDELNVCLNNLRKGDTLYVERESYLASSFSEAIRLLSDLARKGVDIYIARKKTLIKSAHSPFLHLTPDLADSLVGFRNAFSRFRQRLGIKKAREAGVHLGREKKKLPENFEEIKNRWLRKEILLVDAAAACKMSVTGFAGRVRAMQKGVKSG